MKDDRDVNPGNDENDGSDDVRGHSRARARPSTAIDLAGAEAERRVQEIADAMQAGTWKAGESHREKMEAWGVTRSVVNRLAAEAGRSIRRALGDDPDAIVGAYVAQVEKIVADACKVGEFSAAIRGIELKARLLKLIDPRASRGGTPPTWASLTPEQQLARIVAARAHLDALEQNIRANLAAPASASGG